MYNGVQLTCIKQLYVLYKLYLIIIIMYNMYNIIFTKNPINRLALWPKNEFEKYMLLKHSRFQQFCYKRRDINV